jgi:branched-chain amino acid transport system ATP-binding protein
LILDEATEGLAPLIRKEIWNCLLVWSGTSEQLIAEPDLQHRYLGI